MEAPKLCIGLPVYNGEKYIQEAIQSILDQTYTDFCLVISDNASTDHTEEICRRFAASDPRVTYQRRQTNIGAAENFNQLLLNSTSPYFKWAAHDDLLHPQFLEKCVEVLENDPEVILSYTKARKINPEGKITGNYDYEMRVDHPQVVVRFRDLVLTNHFCISAFGVFRRDVLRKTGLIGKYVGSDRVLIAETALYGKQVEIPEYFFYRRDHPEASTAKFNQYDRLAWFDPAQRKKINLKYWKTGKEYSRMIRRTPLPFGIRIACWGIMLRWYFQKRSRLLDDLIITTYQIFPFTRSFTRFLKQSMLSLKGGTK